MVSILARLNRNALGRTNGGAQVTGYAFGLIVGDIQCMQSPETLGNLGTFIRVLQSDRLFEKMSKSDLQSMYYRCNRIHDSILVLGNNV
jgi:hypothetical protein